MLLPTNFVKFVQNSFSANFVGKSLDLNSPIKNTCIHRSEKKIDQIKYYIIATLL